MNCSATDAQNNATTTEFLISITNTVPIAPNVVVNDGAPDVKVSASTAVTSNISVPASVAVSRLNVSSILSVGGNSTDATIGGAVVAITTTSAGSFSLMLPAGLTLSGGDGWNGLIELPRVKAETKATTPIPSSGTVTSTSLVVEVGSVSETLSLSKPARIVLPNQAGKLSGFASPGHFFTQIDLTCDADSEAAVVAQLAVRPRAECSIDVGNDLVIWTKHFTSFITYTEIPVAKPTGGNGPIRGTGRPVVNVPVPKTPVQDTKAPSEVANAATVSSAPAPTPVPVTSGAVASAPVKVVQAEKKAVAVAPKPKAPAAPAKVIATAPKPAIATKVTEKLAAVKTAPMVAKVATSTSATTSLAAVAESQPKTRNGVFGKIKKGFGALTEKIRSGF